MSEPRTPVLFVPHGGGPWPFVDLPIVSAEEVAALSGFLRSLPETLDRRPDALLVVSAHWEEPVPTVTTSPRPPMLYDYYGFPPESYTITWPAPGSPTLAGEVREILGNAGFETAGDPERGFDHGTFVPLKVMFPNADLPAVQLSILGSLDPEAHLALGRAVAPLRDRNVLIVGSGMSYHDLRGLMTGTGRAVSEAFDAWLAEAATADPETRDARLRDWASAPRARRAHPRAEHLMPLLVAAGAAGSDRGDVAFRGSFGDARISAYRFEQSAEADPAAQRNATGGG